MFLIHLTLYVFNMQVVICRSVIILNINLMLLLFCMSLWMIQEGKGNKTVLTQIGAHVIRLLMCKLSGARVVQK